MGLSPKELRFDYISSFRNRVSEIREMSRRGITMTLADVEQHQAKHGFIITKRDVSMSHEIDRAVAKLMPRDKRNKTEREYGLILDAQKRRGDIVHYVYEGIRLTWGDGMHYLADFAVFIDDMPTKLIEVKGGHIWDRDLVRFKGCRAEWKTWFDFELWQKKAGQWSRLL